MSQLLDSGLVESFRDKPFAQLVKHYMDTEQATIDRVQLISERLPAGSERVADKFIDKWNSEALEQQLWKTNTSDVYSAIVEDARRLLQVNQISYDNKDLMAMFSIMVLGYAYYAKDNAKMREFMGIPETSRVTYSTASALSLAYPIAAAGYISSQTPTPPVIFLGYALANLGYLLFAAGLFTGTFLVFNLQKRWQVLTVAGLAFSLGTLLSSAQ